MPEVYTLTLNDEFSYELDARTVLPTRQALRALDDLILVQDDSCEYFVTLSRDHLTLWNPEVHWADQPRRKAQGSLEEVVREAARWLSDYLEVEDGRVDVMLEPSDYC